MVTALAATQRVRQNRPLTRALRERVEHILSESYVFIDSPAFKGRGAACRLAKMEPQLPPMAWYQPTAPDFHPEDAHTFPMIMKGEEETLMFLRYNCSKLHLSSLQRKVKRLGLTRQIAEEVIEWHRRLAHYREYLVCTNLALVLAMARRMRVAEMDFPEMLSEGNMALLRAVEKFDAGRGFKFSTYACRSILKAFSRTALKASRHRTHFPVEFDPEMEESDWSDRRHEGVEGDYIEELKSIVDRNLADLTSVEQTVIRRRFNWQQRETSTLTLQEVGKIIGVTKERVRQIQNKAFAKIRGRLEIGVLGDRMSEAKSEAKNKLERNNSPSALLALSSKWSSSGAVTGSCQD